MKQSIKERIEEIIEKNNVNKMELIQIWQLRENYRLQVETKNNSLNYLLQRAKDAKQIMYNKENGVEEPVAKGGVKGNKSSKGKK